jgi:heme-degrading monooxygenase HmoA
MYIVVSRWEVIPGMEEEFEEKGRVVREILRTTPGVQLVEGFRSDEGGVVAILGYESQDAYNRIVNDESGPFAKAVNEHQLETCGRWVSSDRGESVN